MRMLAWAAPAICASSFQIPKNKFLPIQKQMPISLSPVRKILQAYIKIKLYREIASKTSYNLAYYISEYISSMALPSPFSSSSYREREWLNEKQTKGTGGFAQLIELFQENATLYPSHTHACFWIFRTTAFNSQPGVWLMQCKHWK